MPNAIRFAFALLAASACATACSKSDSASQQSDASDTESAAPEQDAPAGPGNCAKDTDCPEALPHCAESGQCEECGGAFGCPEGQTCFFGACVPGICAPGSRQCSGNTLLVCSNSGETLTEVDCAPGTCEDGVCTGCDPGAILCAGPQLLTCSANGTLSPVGDCVESKLCNVEQGKCTACFPGEGRCEGSDAYACAADGSGFALVRTCNVGEACFLGKCISACDSDLKLNTNVGCDYWAVDLDNFGDPNAPLTAADAPFAVVVTNASDQTSVVKVTDAPDAPPIAEIALPPRGLHVFELPSRNVDGPVKAVLAYHVQASFPIVAYQFNPLENVAVYSNDASVLFPSDAWGLEYMAMSWKQFSPASLPPTLSGFVTIVAAFANTEVTVTPTGPTRGGPDVPALTAGESWTTMLQPYEVLNIESAGAGVDLTGTRITSNKPVGVFGGHECARTSDNTCCCDHLEQQMIPTVAWGKTYVATRSAVRHKERDHWRILAKEDETYVTTTPSQANNIVLQAGQFRDFQSNEPFLIQSNKPIMVGQYLASSFEMNGSCQEGCAPSTTCSPGQGLCWPSQSCVGKGKSSCLVGHTCVNNQCEPIGDPAFILTPPVEQFLADYVFLTPNNYAENYLGVIAPVGAVLVLDNQQSIIPTPISPGAAWASATVPIPVGPHTISSIGNVKFGIVVHGYDDDVSYGYTGGLALEKLQ